MQFIFLMMLGLIAASIVVERVLPQRVKDALGAAICWGMMAFTMASLGAAAVGLVIVGFTQYILPAFS